MRPLVKKISVNFIKGTSVLFLLIMLISEAFVTAHFIESDIIVVYTAVITTLCWLLIGLFFTTYSKWLYIFLFMTVGAFFYLYYFDTRISLAHQQERCMDLGRVWDKEQNICRTDCWKWDSEEGCLTRE